jgi:predicted DNA-binding protein (MmcQ/YjbR family)
MDAERSREFLRTLQHVVETEQWGALVFWTGDKAIGGKMFALVNLEADAHGVASFAAGPERFAELVEVEGLKPAPYMGRIFWVAADTWGALRNAEWESELRAAHASTLAKLPKKVLGILAKPAKEREKIVAAKAKLLAAKAAAAKAKKVASKGR